MRIRTSVVIVIAALTALAAAAFVMTVIRAFFYMPTTEISVPLAMTVPVAPTSSSPARLQIPSLNIDAKVQKVGITAKGDMGIPSNFRDVAWYKHGPTPGQMGSAVISGHVDNALALAGVFRHLEDLKIGDDIYIITEEGSKLHFIVRDIKLYPYNNAPKEFIFTQNDAARLNLITCSGSWLAKHRTYSERLVVYTTFSDSSAVSES